MRWLVVVGIVLLAILVMTTKDKGKKREDVDQMMKRVRAAKAKKARERKD